MRKALFPLFTLVLVVLPAGFLRAEDVHEPLHFSLQFHGGMDYSTGFIQGDQPAPNLGFWMGVQLNNRMDGLWGLDYYTMPAVTILGNFGTHNNPVTAIKPSDDIVLSINARWYLDDKRDEVHRRFNTVPYLVTGLGMDFLVDQYPRPDGMMFYNASYDNLFGVNLGGGVDFPISSNWIFYTEFLDHMIFWQGLTQVFTLHAGFKVMLDTEHVDPFRRTD